MTSDFLYLDWAATAPLSVAAAEAMQPFLTPGIEGIAHGSANANSLYTAGRDAFRHLEAARKDIGRAMGGARPDEVIFTSGATEADNAALFGITDALMMRADQSGDHGCVPKIIISSTMPFSRLPVSSIHGGLRSSSSTLILRGA